MALETECILAKQYSTRSWGAQILILCVHLNLNCVYQLMAFTFLSGWSVMSAGQNGQSPNFFAL